MPLHGNQKLRVCVDYVFFKHDFLISIQSGEHLKRYNDFFLTLIDL